MDDHLFLVNVHKDVAQAARQTDLLSRHFGPVMAYYDGPEPPIDFPAADWVVYGSYEPDKCRGILNALNTLIRRTAALGTKFATFLHPDQIPTDRSAWRRFLSRFRESGKALTYAPVRPGSVEPAFIGITFNLPLCGRLFPVSYIEGVENFNEKQAGASWHRSWPEWRDHAYPLTLLNWPHSTCPAGGLNAKLMHRPGLEWVVHDLIPETSVIHTNDPRFYDNYETILRR